MSSTWAKSRNWIIWLPRAPLEEIAAALKKLLPAVSPEGRLNLVWQIAGDAGDDKVARLVHL
jgi:hypothetical protein